MKKSRLEVPLYHGTSTIFLEGILTFGLGGRNPIADLGLMALIADIRPLVDLHLSTKKTYDLRAHIFARMAEQKNHPRGMNFQHGQSYVSPCRETAVQYAASQRYGSELLTCTLELLRALVDEDVPELSDGLSQRYPRLFGLLDISPAPVLVRVDNVPISSLQDENGNAPQSNIAHIHDVQSRFPDQFDVMLQQTNFRLLKPVPLRNTQVWLLNVRDSRGGIAPDYTLFDIQPSKA